LEISEKIETGFINARAVLTARRKDRCFDLRELVNSLLCPFTRIPTQSHLGEATGLSEVEYGIAVIEYIMLEVARGFYNNRISLEGRTNKTVIL
jgi:hypothetical protein